MERSEPVSGSPKHSSKLIGAGQTAVWRGHQIQQQKESKCLNTALKVLKWILLGVAVAAVVTIVVLALCSPHVLGIALIVALIATAVLGGTGFLGLAVREYKQKQAQDALVATVIRTYSANNKMVPLIKKEYDENFEFRAVCLDVVEEKLVNQERGIDRKST